MTHTEHRQEVLWQIAIPLIIAVVIILAFAIAVPFGGANEVSRWADVSLIWLIIPALFISLVFLIVTAGLAFGVFWLIRKLPPYARLAQDFFVRVQATVRKVSDSAVEPILRIESTRASLRAIRRRLSPGE